MERELLARLLHTVWSEEGGYPAWDDLQDYEREAWRERAKKLGLWVVVRSDLHGATQEYGERQRRDREVRCPVCGSTACDCQGKQY